MYHPQKPFERELAFTRMYQQHQNSDKSTREAACLSLQIPQSFLTLKHPEEELLAGRIENAWIGFHAIAAGSDELDQTAYCFREDRCMEWLGQLEQAGTCEYGQLAEIRKMLDFWRGEHTVAKGQLLYTSEMKRSLAGLDYNREIAMVYPLYRMAGFHLDARKLCRYGLSGLIDLIRQKAGRPGRSESLPLYEGMISVLESIRGVCALYAEEMEALSQNCRAPQRQKELLDMRQNLLHLRHHAPQTLHQAVQLVTLYMLSCDNREIGRLDDYLSEFYERDLQSGRITREFAVRLIQNFFDIIEEEFTRDTRAIIGGVGRENVKAADELALVILDVLDQRPLSWQPQVSLRLYTGMDQRLYDRSLEILGKGRTFPIFYNDDVNVPAVMRSMDVPRRIAEQYGFFGCGEYMISGKSIGTPNALINLAKVLEVTLHNGVDPVTGKDCGLHTCPITEETSWEELRSAYRDQVAYCADLAADFQQLSYDICRQECSFLLPSILTDDCIERGKGVFDGGIEHLGGTVETYGNITVSNSFTAIEDVVFRQQAFSLPRLVELLDCDFVGQEAQRRLLLSAPKYGNDLSQADDNAVWVHENICQQVRRQKERTRMDSFLVVIINNSMNVGMGRCVGATPDGRKATLFLSNANTPYNGQDHSGITAMIRSVTKLDPSIHAGANQNFKLSPSWFAGGATAAKGLLQGFFDLGGQQTNLSVVSQEDLEDAMLHPELHENLIVRVGGYTARFVTLDPPTQRDILTRTAY